MISKLLLFSLLGCCLSVTITSTIDTYETPDLVATVAADTHETAAPQPEATDLIDLYKDSCVLSFWDGSELFYYTFFKCPEVTTTVPEGCTELDLRTYCPPKEFCSIEYRDTNQDHPVFACNTRDCHQVYTFNPLSGPSYVCTHRDPTMCYVTITSTSLSGRSYTTVVPTECGDDNEPVEPTPCTKTFSHEDLKTTITFEKCPLGEITPPPNLTIENTIGCTTYQNETYCPDNCILMGTVVNYYGTIYNYVYSVCDAGDCEFVTSDTPRYSCPGDSYPPGESTACTKTFSDGEYTTTITFDHCPLGTITPPPHLTIPPVNGCTTYEDKTYCPENCVLSGTVFEYYGTMHNYIYSVCDTRGCEFVTSDTPSFSCSATPGEPGENGEQGEQGEQGEHGEHGEQGEHGEHGGQGKSTPCTKTFVDGDHSTTISFHNCPLGTITPPPDFGHSLTVGCTTSDDEIICPTPCIAAGSQVDYYGTPYNYVYMVCGTDYGKSSCLSTTTRKCYTYTYTLMEATTYVTVVSD